MPDDRLAHMFSEASSMIKNSSSSELDQLRRSSQHETHSNEDDSKSPQQSSCTSPFYKEQLSGSKSDLAAGQQQRLRQEEMTQEKMMRLYQEIMSRAPRESAFPG